MIRPIPLRRALQRRYTRRAAAAAVAARKCTVGQEQTDTMSAPGDVDGAIAHRRSDVGGSVASKRNGQETVPTKRRKEISMAITPLLLLFAAWSSACEAARDASSASAARSTCPS